MQGIPNLDDLLQDFDQSIDLNQSFDFDSHRFGHCFELEKPVKERDPLLRFKSEIVVDDANANDCMLKYETVQLQGKCLVDKQSVRFSGHLQYYFPLDEIQNLKISKEMVKFMVNSMEISIILKQIQHVKIEASDKRGDAEKERDIKIQKASREFEMAVELAQREYLEIVKDECELCCDNIALKTIYPCMHTVCGDCSIKLEETGKCPWDRIAFQKIK